MKKRLTLWCFCLIAVIACMLTLAACSFSLSSCSLFDSLNLNGGDTNTDNNDQTDSNNQTNNNGESDNGSDADNTPSTHEHNYNQKIATEGHLARQATCTTQTQYYYSCSCGKNGTATFAYGEALEHSYTVLQYDETGHRYKCENCETLTEIESHYGGAATCTEKAVCSVCKQGYGETLEHSYTVLQYDETAHWHKCKNCEAESEKEAHAGEWVALTPSSCIGYGTEAKSCAVCGTFIGTRTSTAYAAHTPDENGVCTFCKKDLYEGLTFTLSANKSSYTVSAKDTSITNAYILATYKSLPVTSIAWGAFKNCTSLTTVTISSGITSIDGEAFYGCTSLASVTILYGVTSIGAQAFHDCTSLTDITLPDSVTTIGSKAFYNCSSLTGITLPNSLKSIGYYAFYDCTSLKSISIPDGVTSIGNWAFYNCTSLKSATISNSVTSIGNSAFFGCTSLKSITIGNGVTSIEDWAFGSDLTSIYYCGTANEWNNISISSHNTFTKNATIYYYSETKPTTTGNYWHYVDGIATVWTK